MKLGSWDVHWTLSERWENTKRWRWLAWNQLWYDRERRILIFRQIGFLRFDKLMPEPEITTENTENTESTDSG